MRWVKGLKRDTAAIIALRVNGRPVRYQVRLQFGLIYYSKAIGLCNHRSEKSPGLYGNLAYVYAITRPITLWRSTM